LNGWTVGSNGGIWKTTDGGEEWAQSQLSPWLNSVYFTNDSHGWICGQGGSIYKSTDGGEIWDTVSGGSTDTLRCITFNTNQLWIVGDNGTLKKSRNLGANWENIQINTNLNINSIFFTQSNVGWLAVDSGKIFFSSDGGVSWDEKNSITNKNLYSIFFINDLIGWFFGDSLTILKTSDGGESWNLQNSGLSLPAGRFMSSFFTDKTKGWATVGNLGSGSSLLRTTDGGQNWFLDNPVLGTYPKTVFFSDSLTGWVAGSKIVKTIDGGQNWTEQFSCSTLYDIKFLNNDIGWAVGKDGYIFHTTNSGINWEPQIGLTSNHLYSLSCSTEDLAWTVGQFRTILRTTNGGVTFIENENNSTPKDFLLQQNYPNPFNPSTRIQYAISRRQFVTLKVYDLLGKEVATLVNEEKPAGSYEVEFNSASSIKNLASGIYFYRLQAEDFVETKKMLLLK
jgi:photosystem II stability/assembly factor-like uncharacterized protein